MGRWLHGFAGIGRRAYAPTLICFCCLFWEGGLLLSETEIRIEKLHFAAENGVGFKRRTLSERELGFTNILSEEASVANRILENGSGVSLGDVDGDGGCDLYVACLDGPNMLFRNIGDWRFKAVPDSGGAACDGQFSTGVLLVDVNGDRDLDLLVSAIDYPVRLFLNDGQGGLTEKLDSGFLHQPGGTSLSCADVDRDGDLDLYVCHYRDRTVKDERLELSMQRKDGLWVVPPELGDRFISTRNLNGRGILLEQGFADQMYLNDGQGHFQSVPWGEGFFHEADGSKLDGPPLDWSLSASFSDVNDDGFPDLYVCSDFISPDRFWINLGGKGFQAVGQAALSLSSWSSMCVDWADLDLDGDWDFFVGDMLSRDHQRRQYQRANHTPNAWTDWAFEQRRQYMRNTLFLNRGDSQFAEVGRFSGLSASEWTWNCLWLDVDRDGAEDLLLTNGHPHDSLDADWTGKIGAMTAENPGARLSLPSLNTPNLAFRNQGEFQFVETGVAWGFDATTHGQGVSLGDLDGDGDQDMVVNPLNSGLELYENIGGGDLISVQLNDLDFGRTICGSKITLSDGVRSQIREIRAGGRYLSSDDHGVTFGAGHSVGPYELQIRWPDGETSRFSQIEPNVLVTITRHPVKNVGELGSIGSPERAIDDNEENQYFFEDVSTDINAIHQDAPFDDSRSQPMLTQQLSSLAVGIGWIDVDKNGWDDLVIGAGNGGSLSVVRNLRGSHWGEAFEYGATDAIGDQTSLSYFADGSFLVGISGYEGAGLPSPRLHVVGESESLIRSFEMNGLELDALGPVTTGDVDLDGDLDVFVGGRHRVGRYPQSATSVLLLSDQSNFELDLQHRDRFRNLGMVSGAIFCHLNEDKWIDLAIALEWGGVRVFMNQAGVFSDRSEALGLEHLAGLWQSIECGDFDGDGRLDLVVGNWGRNRFPVPSPRHPLRLYYGGTKNPVRYVQLEAYFDERLRQYVPVLGRDRIAEVIPEIVSQYPEYRSFGKASIEDILEPIVSDFQYHEARTLDTVVLLNRGDHFETRKLPLAAQISPVFGLSVADFDGDAREDLFLSQNFYGTELDVSPFDAGTGLWLKGDGAGGFETVDFEGSGLRVFGSGRGSAVSDFDRDGRWDLVVGRHGRAARLYRNRLGNKGVQVGLALKGENRVGIGAVIGLRSDGESGPVRLISGGGGDGAQDTVRPILYCDSPVDEVWVKWPNGIETVTPVPVDVRSVLIDEAGRIVELVR